MTCGNTVNVTRGNTVNVTRGNTVNVTRGNTVNVTFSNTVNVTHGKFHSMVIFYREELSTPRPNPKLDEHPFSAVCDCLFNIFAATFHTGGHSSTRNLRTSHAVVTETHLSWGLFNWAISASLFA